MNGNVKVKGNTRKTIASAVAGLILAATVGACAAANGATVRNGSLDRPAGAGPQAAPAPIVMDESYNSLSKQYAKATASTGLTSTGAAHKESNRQEDRNR